VLQSIFEDESQMRQSQVDEKTGKVVCRQLQIVYSKHIFFFKTWWDSVLDVLKENSVRSCEIWKEAGKPRCGLISDKYRQDQLLYITKRIKEGQAREITSFTNDLHDALLLKYGRNFWKVWEKCKFDCKINENLQVDGTSDAAVIICNFAKHSEKICTP